MLGLAVGDALGTSIEFTGPGPHGLTDMVGGGPFELEPGQWTDDTSMALCLAESLVECGCFAPTDQLERYVRWWRNGYRSSTGTCFDIGCTTRDALSRFRRTGEPFCGSEHPQSAGNGSIMRLAPVPLFYGASPQEAIERAGESSRTTHGAREAVDACRYLGALIAGAVGGASKEQLLSAGYAPTAGYWDERPLSPKVASIAAGSFKHKAPPDIRGRGYVVLCLEAALWAFYRSHSFRSGALLAVNLGEDADTTGAVYGQIAGALYGEDGIPSTWRERLHDRELIADLADQLFVSAHR
jgi:ADP-ribosylglycohydrolase